MVFFFDFDIDSDGPTLIFLELSFLRNFNLYSGYFLGLPSYYQDLVSFMTNHSCVNNPVKGSSILNFLFSYFNALMKNLEYRRCKIACSTPPIY